MTRLKRTLRGVASSYILLAATALYSIGSVPVALHYLETSRFGLWVVMGTLASYLNLIDGGISGAASRLLIDHKDDRDGYQYGGLIQTSCLVSLIQGGVIFLIGVLCARTFAHLMAIPAQLSGEFVELFTLQCGVLAVTFASRIFGLILGAHQRMDLCNYAATLGMVLNFGTQWSCFHLGCGVISMAFGSLAATLATSLLQGFGTLFLKLLPSPGHWGRVSWTSFRELFLYGKDLLLTSIGTQLIRASPGIVITRMLGLEAAAVWGVGTRVFTLLTQIVWRITDMSGGAFAEMMVRGEMERLRQRYIALAMLTFSFSGWVAVSFAFTNSLFISIWTHGKIAWTFENDWLLAILLITSSIVHCNNYFILNTRRIALLPYVYFLEGAVFVSLSLLLVRWGGMPSIIASSVITGILFSGGYGVFLISRYFEIPASIVAMGWLKPLSRMLLWYLPLSVLLWWLCSGWSVFHRLSIQVFASATFGAFIFLRFGVPEAVQIDLLTRIPGSLLPFLGWIIRDSGCRKSPDQSGSPTP